MATSIEQLAPGVFLYVWEGWITLEDIQASMQPEFHQARYVVFDLSGIELHPFRLIVRAMSGHRTLETLEHVYLVNKPQARSLAETLVTTTLSTDFSVYNSRESAIAQAMADAGASLPAE
jgi:hypothetical protein